MADQKNVVTVTESGQGPYGQSITVGGHTFLADEPEPTGADSGPNPYDLLLASLGACTSMTVRMFAERRGWPLESVSVSLTHERIHSRDCAECETEDAMVDRIEREVRLEGDLDEKQRRTLLQIAEKCPVHRTLTSETVILTNAGADGETDTSA
ncbi:OsmC family protein [Spiractinospora alimapuensis]|uniref:OsmC family protein n=1 Tax=Spiractinospora alimapuensis TaxID=2820884 RepID=UPI001F179F28|nr:OsmC family protein [Spiractinospora alimapuensis]